MRNLSEWPFYKIIACRVPVAKKWWVGVATAVFVAGTTCLPWVMIGNACAKHTVLDKGDSFIGTPRIIDGDTLVVGLQNYLSPEAYWS